MDVSRRGFLGAALGVSAAPRMALAQSGAPLKIVFPFAAGGPGDATCRFLAEQLSIALGRPAIVENRTGADGRIGIQSVKSAPPDGNTVLVTTGPTMALMPLVHKTPGYDPEVDFLPVSHLARFEFCIVGSANFPARTIPELVAWVKANPDKATYAVPGLGTIPHFAGVAFSKLIGVDMRRLAYRGGTPAVNDLAGDQIPLGFMTLSDVLQQHLAGRMRVLATLSKSRSPFLPDVPTLSEAGYPIEGTSWYGLWAPAGTSAAIAEQVSKAVMAACATKEAREKFMTLGLILTGTDGATLAAERRALAANWAPTIKASGFTMEQ